MNSKCVRKIAFKFTLYICSVVEQSSVVWGSSITESESNDIERIQKTSLRIILQDQYQFYENALEKSRLPTLSQRREKLMLNFAKKCLQNERTSNMFTEKKNKLTRHTEAFEVPFARTERYRKSSMPTMTRMLNEDSKK